MCIQVERLKSWGRGQPSHYDIEIMGLKNLEFWLLEDWRTSEIAKKYDIIRLWYDRDYPLALMQANVHLQWFMQEYFPRANPFFKLAGELLTLLPALEKTAMDFRQERFAPHTIGLQIRRLKGNQNFLPDVENYARLARAIQQQRGWADNETTFFVASDDTSIIPRLEKILPARSLVQRGKNMSTAIQISRNPGSLQDALVDARLLSFCEEIITTYGSSFGSTAAAWGGIEPYAMLHGPEFAMNTLFTRVSGSSPSSPAHL